MTCLAPLGSVYQHHLMTKSIPFGQLPSLLKISLFLSGKHVWTVSYQHFLGEKAFFLLFYQGFLFHKKISLCENVKINCTFIIFTKMTIAPISNCLSTTKIPKAPNFPFDAFEGGVITLLLHLHHLNKIWLPVCSKYHLPSLFGKDCALTKFGCHNIQAQQSKTQDPNVMTTIPKT